MEIGGGDTAAEAKEGGTRWETFGPLKRVPSSCDSTPAGASERAASLRLGRCRKLDGIRVPITRFLGSWSTCSSISCTRIRSGRRTIRRCVQFGGKRGQGEEGEEEEALEGERDVENRVA